jgi:hypothetical protein
MHVPHAMNLLLRKFWRLDGYFDLHLPGLLR